MTDMSEDQSEGWQQIAPGVAAKTGTLAELFLNGLRGAPNPTQRREELGVATRAQIAELDAHVGKYGPILTGYGLGANIDEVAILAPDTKTLWAWVSLAVRAPDITHVHAASDNVDVVGPIHAHYAADYEFLEVADKPYRIEAMMVASGHSPVHAGHAFYAEGLASWVHASFKCHTEDDYSKTCDALAESGEWLPAQICRSDYGRFTYFFPRADVMEKYNLPMMYLKPRVNLRDGDGGSGGN